MNVVRLEWDASYGDRCSVDTFPCPRNSLSTDMTIIYEGLIWLLIATLAEVPTTVSLI